MDDAFTTTVVDLARRGRGFARFPRSAANEARLDSFGCGLYAPVASNATDDGRGKNRRVELVKW